MTKENSFSGIEDSVGGIHNEYPVAAEMWYAIKIQDIVFLS